ncbi:hypothetical protein ACQP00_33485 [Dactylosporangium sp. CS-047395]|uniref:hypothetical protein n=1 Tax=Dactylosporangium sp. CS-047395 TaxID=3239936 RepID=UPI003D940029
MSEETSETKRQVPDPDPVPSAPMTPPATAADAPRTVPATTAADTPHVAAAASAAEAPPAAPSAAGPPPPPPPGRPGWGEWRGQGWRGGRGRRNGLLIAILALIVGCCLGAGVTAVGALVVGHHHGPQRVGPGWDRNDHYRNGDPRDRRGPGPGYGRPGNIPPAPGATPAAPAPAQTTAAPTPTAS